jgi:antitoxin component YwqK of YwqJK toxin-antitoxin module
MKPIILAFLSVSFICSAQDTLPTADPVTIPVLSIPSFIAGMPATHPAPSVFYDPSGDSIPLLLILPEPAWGIADPWGPIIPPWQPWPQPWPIIWPIEWQLGSYTITLWAPPACGDSYHDNGRLSSRIECVDSVMHGKAVYWDETGHKTTENTYAEGHLIKAKIYDSRGRITSLEHYDYSGQFHGICIVYDYENGTKTVTRYDHGQKHGLYEYTDNWGTREEKVYSHDVAIENRYYQSGTSMIRSASYYNTDGVLIEDKQFTEAGLLYRHEKHNAHGSPEFLRQWNEEGVLIQESLYEGGQPHGTWLTDYHPLSGYKVLAFYDRGIILRTETWSGDKQTAKKEFSGSLVSHECAWDLNGQLIFEKMYDSTGLSGTQKTWNKNGLLLGSQTTCYDPVSATVLFHGTGFYMKGDSLVSFDAGNQPSPATPVKRWVIFGKDTIRMEYALNSLTLQALPSLRSNAFAYDVGDRVYKRHGEWAWYENNKLSKVMTYHFGVAEGRCVMYDTAGQLPVLMAHGTFVADQRDGVWIEFKNGNTESISYKEGLRSGNFHVKDSLGVIFFIAEYTADTLNGSYMEFYANKRYKVVGHYSHGQKNSWWKYYNESGQLIEVGEYRDDKKSGWWQYYNENGELILEGEYENDERVKTWFEYTPTDKKKPEKNKLNYS